MQGGCASGRASYDKPSARWTTHARARFTHARARAARRTAAVPPARTPGMARTTSGAVGRTVGSCTACSRPKRLHSSSAASPTGARSTGSSRCGRTKPPPRYSVQMRQVTDCSGDKFSGYRQPDVRNVGPESLQVAAICDPQDLRKRMTLAAEGCSSGSRRGLQGTRPCRPLSGILLTVHRTGPMDATCIDPEKLLGSWE